VLDRLDALTAGKGPEKCVDAVGTEAHAARLLGSMMGPLHEGRLL
jgi:hypothetical protein